jgi:hypothetical protein
LKVLLSTRSIAAMLANRQRVACLLLLSCSFVTAWNVGAALKSHRMHKKRVNSKPVMHDPADDIRYVVSTGCSAYQHWQVECLKASFLKVKQRGKLTHIVVGCEQDSKSKIATSAGGDADRTVLREEWAKSSNTDVELFFVPAVKMSKEFPWFNKPWSFYQVLISYSMWAESHNTLRLISLLCLVVVGIEHHDQGEYCCHYGPRSVLHQPDRQY